MGLKFLFSSDSRDCNCPPLPSAYAPLKEIRVNSTPDPKDFIIIKHEVINDVPIYLIQYPGVENYEGYKILMYPKNFNTDLIKYRMDPHFFTRGDSPIARFEPTAYGWELAKKLAKNL